MPEIENHQEGMILAKPVKFRLMLAVVQPLFRRDEYDNQP
jgi:hypothetical protein